MCHLTDIQHSCAHWSRRVSYPCPASRQASCINDLSKTFPMPCTNADTFCAVKSVEVCSTCRRKRSPSLHILTKAHIVWNKDYLESAKVRHERVSLEWKEIEWFKADGSSMEVEEIIGVRERHVSLSDSESGESEASLS
jgi:hypothetical protein